MDDDRRKTIETLVELTRGFDAVGCWDPDRAAQLLRNESSPEELISMGVEEELIDRVWPERENDSRARR